ncbi:MAG TPA: NifU family protein [Erysipelothrix sp.]|nr:NifU family protein [Erysipelothrix sp.]
MTLEKRIIKSLDRIRPYIQRDGGNIEFISIDDQGVVTVKFFGACVGCGLLDFTLKGGVEALLMEEVPEVTQVIAQDYDLIRPQ